MQRSRQRTRSGQRLGRDRVKFASMPTAAPTDQSAVRILGRHWISLGFFDIFDGDQTFEATRRGSTTGSFSMRWRLQNQSWLASSVVPDLTAVISSSLVMIFETGWFEFRFQNASRGW